MGIPFFPLVLIIRIVFRFSTVSRIPLGREDNRIFIIGFSSVYVYVRIEEEIILQNRFFFLFFQEEFKKKKKKTKREEYTWIS